MCWSLVDVECDARLEFVVGKAIIDVSMSSARISGHLSTYLGHIPTIDLSCTRQISFPTVMEVIGPQFAHFVLEVFGLQSV